MAWSEALHHVAASGPKPPLVKRERRSRGDLAGQGPGAQTFATQKFGDFFARRAKKAAEPADKPGSVVDSHSSRRRVTAALEQPTRTRRGQRHEVPIWSCSRWGLPYRSVTGLAVRSYRTISPLPACLRRLRRYLSVALSVGSRRPGVTWHLALWSPDFPRHRATPKCTAMTRLSGRLRRAHCRTFPNQKPMPSPSRETSNTREKRLSKRHSAAFRGIDKLAAMGHKSQTTKSHTLSQHPR